MALGTAATIALWTMAAATVAQTGMSISAAQSAKKRAKGLAEQAIRIKAGEKARLAETTKKAEALAGQAETLPERAKQAAITAGLRKKRRATIATGPQGLFGEPSVTKPTLLGA